MSGELLDEATVAALATRLVAAQATVTSTQMRVYMSIAASFPGEPPVAMEDVPLMTITDVGGPVTRADGHEGTLCSRSRRGATGHPVTGDDSRG